MVVLDVYADIFHVSAFDCHARSRGGNPGLAVPGARGRAEVDGCAA